MLPRPLTPLVLALLAFLLVATSQAQAEPIQWTYSGEIFTTGPNSVPFTGEGFGPKVLIAGIVGPSGRRVEFADVSGSAAGTDYVNAFQMRVLTDLDTGQGHFQKDVHTFDLTVGLKDGASGASGSLTFKGNVDGTIYSAFLGAELKVGFKGLTSQSLVLGDHQYKVSIEPFKFGYSPAGKEGFSDFQNVPMHVQVTQVTETPEPSTLVLAAVGLAGLGVRQWRRRRGNGV